eukprot:TRINITY_DN3986_c0_g1_i1.p1 TRINITY_DN3986_c0_g1~~TRINITY_DN3986_c0_g1_i1.p1  ORF type:complete len:111 (-),score=24.88 TRINITY_DN3986_c0_g1_i1:53-385(-)
MTQCPIPPSAVPPPSGAKTAVIVSVSLVGAAVLVGLGVVLYRRKKPSSSTTDSIAYRRSLEIEATDDAIEHGAMMTSRSNPISSSSSPSPADAGYIPASSSVPLIESSSA